MTWDRNSLAITLDNRLYREVYGTFEEYCKEKWDISRPRAYQLIKAAEVQDNLSTIVDTPIKEGQARPLSSLPPDEQREVYERQDALDSVVRWVETHR